MRRLTDRQRRFVELYAAGGLTMRDAYRAAFDNHTAKDTTISPKASRLMAQPHVAAHLRRLRNKAFMESLARDRAGFHRLGRFWP